MGQSLPSPAACDTTCVTKAVTHLPGPTGATGTPGTSGVNGVNAFTLTLASFTQPGVNGFVTVEVANSDWSVIGQIVYVQNGGYYLVSDKPDSSHITLENLGYDGNVVHGTVVALYNQVGPAGQRGVGGSGGGSLDADSPTTGAGQLLVDNGDNAPDASLVAFQTLDGFFLMGDSGATDGVSNQNPALVSVLTGFVSGDGDVADTDTILESIQKLDGRIKRSGDSMTGNLTVPNVVQGQGTLAYAATVNIDFNGEAFQTVTLAGNITFTTSNRAAGKAVSVRVICDGSSRNFTFPSWVFIGAAAPASINASKTAILSLTCFDANDTGVIAAYSEQP
jgi:hypothetical protein